MQIHLYLTFFILPVRIFTFLFGGMGEQLSLIVLFCFVFWFWIILNFKIMEWKTFMCSFWVFVVFRAENYSRTIN